VLVTEVDWSEPQLQRWFNSIAKKNTKKVYRKAWRAYMEYIYATVGYRMTARQLLEEAIEDNKRDLLERRNLTTRQEHSELP